MSFDFLSNNIVYENNRLIFKETISQEEMLNVLNKVYTLENKENFSDTILLDLKKLDAELLTEAFRYSLKREDLKDPLMLLNIINLIKTYNTLDDSFFENEDIYFASIDTFLDIKALLNTELKYFSKTLSIYFISLLKSYSKTEFFPSDIHVDLPEIYKNFILSTDFFTLCSIFSKSESFNTENCIYINDAIKYITLLLNKNTIGYDFFNIFMENFNVNSNE